MAWAGGVFTRTNGTYSGSAVWQSDAAAAIKIRAGRHDFHDQDLAQGINNCITKDGQNSPNQHISWGGFKITSLANGTAAGDAVNKGQLDGVGALYVLKAGDTMTGALVTTQLTSTADVRAAQNFVATTGTVILAPTGAGVVRLRPNGAGSSAGETTISAAGVVAVAGNLGAFQVSSGGGNFISDTGTVTLAPTGAGLIRLRPNGSGSSAGETTITSGGVVAINGNMSAFQVSSGGGNFIGATNAILAPSATGSVYLRPNGAGSATSEMQVNTAGTVTSNGSGAGYTFVDRTSGRQWLLYGTGDVCRWYNGTSGIMDLTAAGNLSATNFIATSDIRLKNVTGAVAPRDFSALGIIEWTWKDSDEYGIGVGAQSVQCIAKEYVHESEDGTLSVDKGGLALEWAASLEKKIKLIEARLQELEG